MVHTQLHEPCEGSLGDSAPCAASPGVFCHSRLAWNLTNLVKLSPWLPRGLNFSQILSIVKNLNYGFDIVIKEKILVKGEWCNQFSCCLLACPIFGKGTANHWKIRSACISVALLLSSLRRDRLREQLQLITRPIFWLLFRETRCVSIKNMHLFCCCDLCNS